MLLGDDGAISFFKKYLLILFVCVCVGGAAHMHLGAPRGQKRLSDPLELWVEVAVNLLMRVL